LSIIPNCKGIKKRQQILTATLLTVLLLPVFLYAIFRTTPVQTYLANRAGQILSEQLGTNVEVGGLDISWFLRIVLTDVHVDDQHQENLLSLKRIELKVNSINFRNRNLQFDNISLQNTDLRLVYYEADSALNLQFLVDHFTSEDTIASAKQPWEIAFNELEIKNSRFRYLDERYSKPGKGMDYSDLDIGGLNLKLNNIGFIGDTIKAQIHHLTAVEKCGFRLKSLNTNATVSSSGIQADGLHIITDKSNLALNLKFSYTNWNAFNDFIDSVKVDAKFDESFLDLRDLVCFAPELDGMKDVIGIKGKIKGTVASFTGKQMQISLGGSTTFDGNIRISGLPNIEESFVHLNINDFITDSRDIAAFSLPYSSGLQGILLPPQIAGLGKIRVMGKFTGFYNDFVSNATFSTDAGEVTTDILLAKNREDKLIHYNGHLTANRLDVGRILDTRSLGTINLDVSLDGKGLTSKTADLMVKGKLSQCEVMGNTLNEAHIDGQFAKGTFDGELHLTDELVELGFNGTVDVSDSLPAFRFKADLKNALLTKLNLWNRDSTSMLTTHMDLDFTGNTLDNLLGSLVFKNTSYSESGKQLAMRELSLVTQGLQNNNKRMSLNCDYANAMFSGQYTFDDLAEYLTFVFTDYLPALALVAPAAPRQVKGSFDYTIQLNNTDPLTAIFFPELRIHQGTVISGGFDPMAGLVNVNGRSPMINLYGISFYDWSLRGFSENGRLAVEMLSQEVELLSPDEPEGPSAGFEQFLLRSSAQNDSVLFQVSWNDKDTIDDNKASLSGALCFSAFPVLEIKLDSSQLMINDTLWTIQAGNSFTIDTASFAVNRFRLASSNQSMEVNGRVSMDPLDRLEMRFDHFNVSQFDVFTVPLGINFDGLLSGMLKMSDLYRVPVISANLMLARMGFNNEMLGDAEIVSEWDNVNQAVLLDSRINYKGNAGIHQPLIAKGAIYTKAKDNNFDLDIKLDNIKLKVLQPFFTGLFSRIKGWGSGELTLTGKFGNPVLAGSVKMMRSEMLVDYLRTTYSFTGEMHFDEGRMYFNNLNLADSVGNTGSATGTISHHSFGDWNLDIQLLSNNLTVLNTSFTQAEMYYGKARAQGKMHLSGPVNDLKLDVQATSIKGTDIFIPINYAVDISENDYIYYVQTDTSDKLPVLSQDQPSNIELNLDLDVTKDANIEIILPYRMGNIKVKGDGLINMGIDTRGDYTMHGQYVMDKGSFLFNLQDIFSRNFEIRKGSTITFNGTPDDADINLQAVYKIKTNLSGLATVPVEAASRRIPVDCIIALTNDLYNPDIHFSISLPDADAETQRWVYGAIDTSNAVAMNQQMISLLVLNSFTSAGETSSAIPASGLGVSSFGIISSQLNNWLSQISKDFDIGVNYRPGDQMSAQELELALSTQLFNDRVVIDGTFGMSSYASTSNSQNPNQWIGDVNVEVKITEDGRFRVKAFNRTNTSLDLYTGQSPYTKGVGILYRKDFDHFMELFRRQRQIK